MQCFSSKTVLTKHKDVCLSVNDAQSVKLEQGTIEFENYFKQIPVPLKIYGDFEYNLEGVVIFEGFYTKNIFITFVVVLLTKLFVLMISLVNWLLLSEVRMRLINLLKQFLKSMNTAKKVMKKHFNKNLIISEEKEEQFQSSNNCWMWKTYW